MGGVEWEAFVKARVCSDTDAYGTVYPIAYPEPFIEGPISGNYSEIRGCRKPKPGPGYQVAAVTPDAIAYTTSKIVGVIVVT